ncbi:unnamed protein product [Ascophyllum nodosum]
MRERAPRGRCLPPIPPAPNPTRGEKTKSTDQGASTAGKGQPRVVVVFQSRPDSRKPIPRWKHGYVAFEHKINSSVFMPLLVLLVVCGAGIHIVGLTAFSRGYFRWDVACEEMVMMGDYLQPWRIDGIQTYRIGWAQYHGVGPKEGSDATAMSSTDNGTVGVNLGLEGVAGSSIPELHWLAGIDGASAALGAMTTFGHLLGSAFYAIMLSAMVLLLRSSFRSRRKIFWPALIPSGVLLVWLLTVAVMGFRLVVRWNFREKILDIFYDERFSCQDEGKFGGDFAYIATSFGCITSAVVFFLIWRYGHDADFAVTEHFGRQGSLVEVS